MGDTVFVCLDDFEKFASSKLPKGAFDYYRSGADDQLSLKRNRQAFERWLIRPRMLRDVSHRDLKTSVLGGSTKLDFPIGITSTSSQRLAHPDGEEATVKAAGALNSLMIASTIATTSLEDIAKASPNANKWFQLYVYKDRDMTVKLVRRAEKAGYKALAVTVDTPMLGKRRDDMRNGFSLPPHLRMANFDQADIKSSSVQVSKSGSSWLFEYAQKLFDPSLTWNDIEWLTKMTKLPVIVKGILTAHDAMKAYQYGAKGVIVSNHGARQLDSVPAPIEVLPEISKVLDGRCDVFLEGGVRTGNDVFKALALGAKAVFVGRPALWALTYKGQEGVEKMLNILREELDLTMSLAGCRSISEIDQQLLVHESYFMSSKL